MKTFLKLFLAVLLIAIISLGFIGCKRFQSPTTVEMEEFFAANRVGFEQKNAEILAALTQKTAINLGADAKVAYKWFETQPNHDFFQDGEPIIIRYYTHLWGIGVGVFGTGIAYIDPSIQEKIYPSLETMTDDAKKVEGFVGYSHITGNWHSFFWEAD